LLSWAAVIGFSKYESAIKSGNFAAISSFVKPETAIIGFLYPELRSSSHNSAPLMSAGKYLKELSL